MNTTTTTIVPGSDGKTLATALSAWQETPVSVLTSEQVNAAAADLSDASGILASARIITARLSASHGIDPGLGVRAFGIDVIAAVAVARHRRDPAVTVAQARRIGWFLSQPAVRERLGGTPANPLPDTSGIESFNPDGTITPVTTPVMAEAA